MASKDAQRIRNYVRSLDRNDRYILMLYYADGLTTLEIGTLLGLSASNVHGRLDYFRGELGNILQHPETPRGTDQRPAAFA